jgi:hypothetical protein
MVSKMGHSLNVLFVKNLWEISTKTLTILEYMPYILYSQSAVGEGRLHAVRLGTQA